MIKFIRGVAFVCAVIPLFALAQVQTGGAKNPAIGGGFGCGAGMTWTVVDGMARCTAPVAAAPTGASCAANANYTKGACAYSVVGSAHGGIVSGSNKTAGYTGAVSLSCNNGSWTEISATCSPNSCPATSTAASGCTFNLPATASGTSVGGTLTAPATYTGSLTGTCNLGAWSFGAATCTPPPPANCGATTLTAGMCSYPMPATLHGASKIAATITPSYTGSITGTCTNGTWTQSGASCSLIIIPPVNCSATTLSSGACSYSMPATLHGASKTASTFTPSYTGAITGTCTNGTWTQSAASCNPNPTFSNCGATTMTYGNCAYSVPGMPHNTSVGVANYTAGYTGSITAFCNNGGWSQSGATCNANPPPPPPPPPANCASLNTTWGACAYTLPATASGGSVNPATNTIGYMGSYPATCNNGSWIPGTPTCTPSAAPVPVDYQLACFVGGTNVRMASGEQRPIESIIKGEEVIAYDEVSKTFVASVVAEVMHHAAKSDSLVEFNLSNGKMITSNSIHLILVNGEYMAAGDIAKQFNAGQAIVFTSFDSSAGLVTLKDVKVFEKSVPLFNLQVRSKRDTELNQSPYGHNYVAEGIVVHNDKALATINAWVATYPNAASNACEAGGGQVMEYYMFPRRVMCEY